MEYNSWRLRHGKSVELKKGDMDRPRPEPAQVDAQSSEQARLLGGVAAGGVQLDVQSEDHAAETGEQQVTTESATVSRKRLRLAESEDMSELGASPQNHVEDLSDVLGMLSEKLKEIRFAPPPQFGSSSPSETSPPPLSLTLNRMKLRLVSGTCGPEYCDNLVDFFKNGAVGQWFCQGEVAELGSRAEQWFEPEFFHCPVHGLQCVLVAVQIVLVNGQRRLALDDQHVSG